MNGILRQLLSEVVVLYSLSLTGRSLTQILRFFRRRAEVTHTSDSLSGLGVRNAASTLWRHEKSLVDANASPNRHLTFYERSLTGKARARLSADGTW